MAMTIYYPLGAAFDKHYEIKDSELKLLASAERQVFEKQCKKPCKYYFEGEFHEGPRSCHDFVAAEGRISCANYKYDKLTASFNRHVEQNEVAKKRVQRWCSEAGVDLSDEERRSLEHVARGKEIPLDDVLSFLALLKSDDMACRLVKVFESVSDDKRGQVVRK